MLSREKTKTDDQRQDVNDYPVKEQYVLSRLLSEYVSLYRIELNSGKYEILRLDANTNARQLAEKDPHPAENFDEYISNAPHPCWKFPQNNLPGYQFWKYTGMFWQWRK